jgi:hypothetical protein
MKKKFAFNSTFRAPILHRPPPTAAGAAAAQTAPAKVVMAFLRATGAGDKSAIRNLLTAEYGKPLDGPQSKNILAAWKMQHANAATTEIGTVDIKGSSAEVVIIDKSKGGATSGKFTLVLEGGQWRIDSVMI